MLGYLWVYAYTCVCVCVRAWTRMRVCAYMSNVTILSSFVIFWSPYNLSLFFFLLFHDDCRIFTYDCRLINCTLVVKLSKVVFMAIMRLFRSGLDLQSFSLITHIFSVSLGGKVSRLSARLFSWDLRPDSKYCTPQIKFRWNQMYGRKTVSTIVGVRFKMCSFTRQIYFFLQ